MKKILLICKIQNIKFKLLASLTEIRLRNFNFKFKSITTLESKHVTTTTKGQHAGWIPTTTIGSRCTASDDGTTNGKPNGLTDYE